MQDPMKMEKTVRLGKSDLDVHRVGLGAWPMAGLTSLGVTDDQSIGTIRRALELGINHLDTAYSYGIDGRSDRVIAKALEGVPRNVILASKVGAKLDEQGVWRNDARPESMIEQARQLRDRLRVEVIDLLYLHAPDPKVPLLESADALKSMVDRGWARWAGVSNVTANQLDAFHRRCPVVAVQTYFNMFQQDRVEALRETCHRHSIAIVAYWVLMKGLLAGRMERDHELHPQDRRRNYPIYQGNQWQASQDLLDTLRGMASSKGCTVAQLVVAWTLMQPGIAVALVGAKRPDQIEETANSIRVSLSLADREEMQTAIAKCKSRGDWSR